MIDTNSCSRLPQVDIGIPVLNEALNIDHLLSSIKDQKQDQFEIANIFLISDGSTDDTIRKAQLSNLPGLTLVDHRNRKGKSFRMDEIFQMAKSDILVLLDGDVKLAAEHTLSKLVEPIIQKRATLVSGHPVKISTGSFTDRVMDVSQFLQDYVKQNLNNGDSLYACHGRIVALHRYLFSQLALPFSSVGNDAYLYIFNQFHGRGFEYIPEAVVHYKMPQTLSDFIRQQRRFAITPSEQTRLFGVEVASMYKIPLGLALSALLKSMKYHFYVLCYLYYRYRSKVASFEANATWETSNSTKKL